MLMVLMAIIELGRSNILKASRWLWMVLTGGLWMGAQTGCFDPDPDDKQDVRTDVIQPDAQELDTPILPDLPDAAQDCGLVTYYGPKPCATDQECIDDYGAGWYCDTENAFSDPCGGVTTWPMCKQGNAADVIEPDVPPDALDVVTPDTPSDILPDCEPMVAYGPPPCTSDADCTPWGQDYICDFQSPWVDPCTGKTLYMCREATPTDDVIEPVDAVTEDTPTDVEEQTDFATFYGPPMAPPAEPSK